MGAVKPSLRTKQRRVVARADVNACCGRQCPSRLRISSAEMPPLAVWFARDRSMRAMNCGLVLNETVSMSAFCQRNQSRDWLAAHGQDHRPVIYILCVFRQAEPLP